MALHLSSHTTQAILMKPIKEKVHAFLLIDRLRAWVRVRVRARVGVRVRVRVRGEG